MRASPLLFVAVSALAQVATAQSVPAFPAGALETEARLLARVGPQTRSWIRQEAAREVAAGTVSQEAATSAAAGYGRLGGLGSSDVAALAFLVMMEAAKASHEDLKAIMGNVKRIDEAKASLRQRAPTPGSTAAGRSASAVAGSAPPRTAVRAAPTAMAPGATAIAPGPLSKPEFDRRFDQAKNSLDAMNELGEMESLRLQMAMDRMSKLMSTLSNMLKKFSDTASGITQNLK